MQPESTRRPALRATARNRRDVGAPVVGFVLNRIGVERKGYYGRYRYYSYGRYNHYYQYEYSDTDDEHDSHPPSAEDRPA